MDEKYKCAFKPDDECPVRGEFKLQPENLLEFCKVCYKNPNNQQRDKTLDTALFVNTIWGTLSKYIDLEKKEKQELMQILNSLIVKPMAP